MWPAKPRDCIAHVVRHLTQDEVDIAEALIDIYAWATAVGAVLDLLYPLGGKTEGE